MILQWLMQYRMANQERNCGITNLVCLDECKTYLNPFKNDNIGWHPITYLLSEITEFGVGILLNCLDASEIRCGVTVQKHEQD